MGGREWSGAACGVRGEEKRGEDGGSRVALSKPKPSRPLASWLTTPSSSTFFAYITYCAHMNVMGGVSQAYAAQTGSGCAVGATGAERVAVRSVCGACAVHVRCGACVQLMRLGAMLVLPLPES